jgi:hypothetical protein
MFHENSASSTVEPGAAALVPPTLGEHLEAERPVQNNDVDVPANIRAITPSAFYWTKGYGGQPTLQPHPFMAPYLANVAGSDPSSLDDLPNAADIRKVTKSLLKLKVDEKRLWDSIDASGWLGNTETRAIYQLAGQAQIEVVYWKDELAKAVDRATKKNVAIHEDKSCQFLSGFRDNAIRNEYIYKQLAIALHDKGEPPIDLKVAATSFLKMRAAMETKRLLGSVNNAQLENALSSDAAKAIDPTAGARAAALKAAMEAAKKAA